MSFYNYIFYRLMGYYNYKDPQDKWVHAFIIIGAIFLVHILTILFYVSTFLGIDIVNSIRTGNGIFDRFITFPLAILPIYIILFLYYRKNKDLIKLKIESYKQEDIKQKRKKGVLVVLYLILTFALLLSSITSPIWLK